MGEQVYMRKLLRVTVEDEHFVVRHLECGHVVRFECLFGEAERVAAEARQLIGTKIHCEKCAAKEE